MTVTQFVTDLCLNEVERRGELRRMPETGQIVADYWYEYIVPTVLTRESDRPPEDQCVGPDNINDMSPPLL